MTKISRLYIEKEKMGLFLDDFWAAIAALKSKVEAKNFFSHFLTHTERKMFAKRFQIAMMLILGYKYETIKNRVKVTEGTIARINNLLGENESDILPIAQRIIRLKEQRLSDLETRQVSIKGRSGGKSIIEEGVGGIVSAIEARNKQKSITNK